MVRIGTQNEGKGRYQQFNYSYKVVLKSKSNHDLAGCNLHQAATSVFTYLNAADAKAQTAADYPGSEHTNNLTSTVNGNVVTTKNPDDYVSAGLEITDNPGFFRGDFNGSTGMLTNYRFTGDDYVEEASDVKGSIEMNADFDFVKIGFTWSVRSSDGKINRSGSGG